MNVELVVEWQAQSGFILSLFFFTTYELAIEIISDQLFPIVCLPPDTKLE